jgi:hypothetical protein
MGSSREPKMVYNQGSMPQKSKRSKPSAKNRSQNIKKSNKSGPTYYTQTSSELKQVPNDFNTSFGPKKLSKPKFNQGRLNIPKNTVNK